MDEDGGGLAKPTPVKTKQSRRRARYLKHLDHFRDRLHELGWRRSFISANVWDGAIPAHDFDEQPESVLLDEMTKSWLPLRQEYGDDRLHNTETETDIDLLCSAGLKRRVAQRLCEVIAPLQKTCYTERQLLEIAVEYALGKHEKIMKPSQEYFVDTQSTDTWTPNAIFEYVYNVSDFSSLSDKSGAQAIMRSLPGVHSSATLFYHATSCRSIQSIVTYGVDHTRGRRCLDFGIRPSFYVTPDLNTAVAWCHANERLWQGEMCILVFSLPDSLRALKRKVFNDADEEWASLVAFSRRCVVKMNVLDTFDVVYGPMAANIKSIKTNLARPHKTPKFQLASKSNDSDTYMAKHIAGAIFARVKSKK